MSIRGIYSTITDIRRQVFTEVARIGYEGGDYSRIEDLPYKIVPGEVAEHRGGIFLERAIVGERLRLAMGLSPRPLDQHAPLAAGVEESARPEKYYEPPLVNILKFACNACPEKRYIVTNLCQNCLAHPCREICPKKAVKLSHRGVSRIQEDLCISAASARMSAPTMRSFCRSARAPRRAVWTPSGLTSTAAPISIMISASRAACVL